MAVAALLDCHSASGTFEVTDTEVGLNLNILDDLRDSESEYVMCGIDGPTRRCKTSPSAVHWEKLRILEAATRARL
jgi:hypothetical protein